MIQYQYRASIVAASVFVAAAFAPGAALACNPIQFLFGGCRPQPAPQPQTTLEHLIDREQGPAHAKRKPVATGPARGAKQAAIAPPSGASVGSVAHFAEDKTLRRGDVVVTSEGFLVYRGQGGAHSRNDFEPLTKARDDLASLEKASRNPGVAYAPVAVSETTPKGAKSPLSKTRPEPKEFEAKVSE